MGSKRLNCWRPVLGVTLLAGACTWSTSGQNERSAIQRASVQRPGTPAQAPQHDRAIADAAAQAARRKAVENLYVEIQDLPLGSQWTVGKYVQYMSGREEMLRGLAEAEQIGAPRWNEHTVQIRLEIPASRVKRALERIAASRPQASPITPEQIDWYVNNWTRRSFGADGASMAPRGVAELRPRFSPRWQRVGDEVREKALAAATDDAVGRALGGVAPVRLGANQTLGDAFGVPQVGQRVRDWLATRPVTQVDFRENGELFVEMVLAVNESEFFQTVRDACAHPRVTFPQDPEQVKRVEREFYDGFRPAIGRAVVERGAAPRVNVQKGLVMPAQEPDWVQDTARAMGTVPFSVPYASAIEKLRIMGQAERDAARRLREKIETLSLDGTTVGEAAKQDPRIEAALRRALGQAELARTDLRPGQAVVAEMSLDLRVLWDELNR